MCLGRPCQAGGLDVPAGSLARAGACHSQAERQRRVGREVDSDPRSCSRGSQPALWVLFGPFSLPPLLGLWKLLPQPSLLLVEAAGETSSWVA